MKKIYILALAAAAAIIPAQAQQKVMRIHLADGTSITQPVSNVTKITFEGSEEPGPDEPTEKLVDLGLSVKWATYNMGATRPSEGGNFYAYGEIEPKDDYTIDNYKWAYWDYNDWDCDPWEQYLKLGATITGSYYDVAHMKWGDQWRMPTKAECEEMLNNCTWELATVDGVKGILGTSTINGNTIFFPYAGNKFDGQATHQGTNAFLWTATEYEQDDITAEVRNYRMCIDSNYQLASGYDYPEVGFNVRAVYGPAPEPAAPEITAPTAETMVDLGLSVKWSAMNLGASSPTGKGAFFCWGETWEKQYSHSYNYKYFNPYDETYEDIGENICGNATYDPAAKYWGDGWRMPTKAELEELINNCTWTYTSSGATVTGPNGNSIFLPALGMMSYKGQQALGRGSEEINYLSGETADATSASCYSLVSTRSGYGSNFATPSIRTWSARAGGVQVRPVHE